MLTYSNTTTEKREFQIAAKSGKIQFLVISGQHSSAAAKRLLEWAQVNSNISDIAKKLTYQKSQILSASTPITVLAEHSFRSNAVNQTMEFKSFFLDTVVHARRQWIECNRPAKPSAGEKACSSEEHKRFQVIEHFQSVQINSTPNCYEGYKPRHDIEVLNLDVYCWSLSCVCLLLPLLTAFFRNGSV